ncbi:MAG: hypothetical protein KDM63_01785, partial [Verrucomicrobiae bacterium]|nr:hypothetical protein [Verrucomicrobiae bacterium]
MDRTAGRFWTGTAEPTLPPVPPQHKPESEEQPYVQEAETLVESAMPEPAVEAEADVISEGNVEAPEALLAEPEPEI